MSVMKYKDPETGEVKKVFAPTFDAYTKTETNTLLNSKAPATHASQHASGGSDPINPVAIGAFRAHANYGTNIFSNDLNDWVTPGAYSVPGKSQGTLNTPVDGDGWGTILVSGGFNDRVFQIFSAWNANTLYWRANHNGTWTSWYKFYDTLNKPKFSDIAFLGINPISSTTDDTTTNWANLGSGFAWYNVADKLNGQPSQYGHLISYSQGADIFQIWNTQAGGPTYFRSGNSAGWNGGWRKVYDTSNITYGTTDLTAGSSSLANGSIYFVYE